MDPLDGVGEAPDQLVRSALVVISVAATSDVLANDVPTMATVLSR
jgi:hypothetical protein